MTNKGGKEGRLWGRINENVITEATIEDLENFKTGPINHKLALWNPEKNGVRYLKTLIYNICESIDPTTWDKIQKTKNRELGNPISIRYAGNDICLDYLQAALEVSFMEDQFDFSGSTVLEIGAGYGRTCHTILSNFEVKNYTIVDLGSCMKLSQKYLKEVLSEENYKKIQFIDAEEIHTLHDTIFDLALNIDSFAEMESETVNFYLEFINDHCTNMYVKNPVGKYWDKSLDGHLEGDEVVREALKTGLLREIIDIHDNEAVLEQSSMFIKAYQPNKSWKCISDSNARPWTFYWQAFYKI